MASKYQRCPNCSSQEKGLSVKKCRDYNKIFCSNCENSSWTSTCPNCNSNSCSTIGYVDPNA